MDKVKKRVRAHAEKHGMSYQAAWNLLEGDRDKQALEFWDWMEHVNSSGRKDCLTIADVLKMKKGERVDLLVMDRNLCDHVYPDIGEAPRPTLPPEVFFDMKRDGAVYVHGDGITGTMEWGWDHERKRINESFTFEVEYAPNHWHPLKDGRLPTPETIGSEFAITTDELLEMLEEDYPGMPFGKHWKDLPETTRVGWRGPAMRWSDVPKQPPVFTNIDVDHLAVYTLLPMLKETLGLEDERLWMERDEEGWVIVVRDLTDDEREEIGRRFRNARVISRAERNKGEMLLRAPSLTGDDRKSAENLVLKLTEGGEDDLKRLANILQSEVAAFLEEEVDEDVSDEKARKLLGKTLVRVATDVGLDREAVGALLPHFDWGDGVAPLALEELFGTVP